MSSVFDQKIAAARDRIPASVLDSPWKRTLLLVAFLVFMVGAVFVFLLVAVFWLLKGFVTASGKSSDSSAYAEDTSPDAYGYEPGNIFYTEPGVLINPILDDVLHSNEKKEPY